MSTLPSNLIPLLINGGTLKTDNEGHSRLTIPSGNEKYCDSQLDDYHILPRKQFIWTPPCAFEIKARASSSTPPGTLGFGFWNDPFTFSMGQGGAARRLPASPQTLWFFYGSQENDIRLNPEIPGWGWKASSIRSPQLPLVILAPLAATALAASYVGILRSILMKFARRIVSVEEVLLKESLDQWHTYSLEWVSSHAIFSVDGQIVLKVNNPPSGPLGFVAWIDNQYAIASPEERFHFGVIQTHTDHWLELEFKNLSNL